MPILNVTYIYRWFLSVARDLICAQQRTYGFIIAYGLLPEAKSFMLLQNMPLVKT